MQKPKETEKGKLISLMMELSIRPKKPVIRKPLPHCIIQGMRPINESLVGVALLSNN